MPDDSLAYWDFHFLRLGLLPDGFLEGEDLVFRDGNEEGFEQHDGFPETGVDIVVIRVYGVPSRPGIGSRALDQVRSGKTKVLFEISYDFLKSIDFVDELETVGQEHSIEKCAHASGALAFESAEIGGIQRGGVWHGAVMLCMLPQGPKKARERLSEKPAKAGREAKYVEGSPKAAFLTKTYGFVQRDAEHGVIGFELLLVPVENCFFSLRQPGVPVFLDRPSAG